MPFAIASRGEWIVRSLPLSGIEPAVAGWIPNSASATSVRPEPIRPAKPRTSPRLRSKRHVFEDACRCRDPCTDRIDVALFGRRALLEEHLAAHHVRDRPLRRHVGARPGRNQPAVAEHRDPVGDLEHLLHPVADEDDRDTAVTQVPDDLEELRNLVRRKRRGRLVHDQDADIERDRLGDLHGLLRGQRQATGRTSHVERHAERGKQALCLARHRAANWSPRRGSGWLMKMFSATFRSGNSSGSW